MNKIELKQLIESDLTRYGYSRAKKPSMLKKAGLYGYIYSSTMRKTKFYKNTNYLLYLIYRLKLRNLMFKFGFQIPYTTKIGKGLYIGHFGRIIINANSEIGDNVNLSPGVTIGGIDNGANKGAPIISSNVWIGTNAIIVGGIRIGTDVIIAPNSFVNNDVPDHSIVIGNPAIIHKRDYSTEYYIENKA